MEAIRSFTIHEDLDTPDGGLAAHLIAWSGVRVGVGHKQLDDLRERVLERARAIAERYREPLEVPRLEELGRILYGSGVSPWQWPPTPASHLRELIRGEAFPVVNDAVDLARLFGLTEMLPTYVFDPSRLGTALELGPGDTEMTAPRGPGPESAANIPVVHDRSRILFSLCHENQRPEVSPSSQELVFLVLEPWPSTAPFDLGRGVRRLENWCTNLLGGKRAGVRTVGGPPQAR